MKVSPGSIDWKKIKEKINQDSTFLLKQNLAKRRLGVRSGKARESRVSDG